MKKVTLIIGVAVLLISCGEDQQAKVCECSKLYDEISLAADKEEEAGEDYMDAMTAAQKASNGKFEECDEFHTKVVGDEEFFNMSEKCK